MIRKINVWFTPIRILAVVLITLAAVIGFVGYMADLGVWAFGERVQTLVIAFYANASAELVSIVFTILVIDSLNERRTRDQEKRRLILQMGSPDNGFALEAVRILGAEGWLADGSLHGADLWRANLAGALLERARLVRVELNDANLEGASLWGADLRGANLSNANLRGANLWRANLKGANLSGANIEGVHLNNANLEGANLWSDTLDKAWFEGATLPDGTKLPGREEGELGDSRYPAPDWQTPFKAWVEAKRPRVRINPFELNK